MQQIVDRIHAGNVYVNRNQIGAIVGSQPFGGEGLSGTGPKAGGPLYVARFQRTEKSPSVAVPGESIDISAKALQEAIDGIDPRSWPTRPDRVNALRSTLSGAKGMVRKALSETAVFAGPPQSLPGPTGESNRYELLPRGTALCLGPTAEIALAQAVQALGAGCSVVLVAPDVSSVAKSMTTTEAPIAVLDGTIAPDVLTGLSGISIVAAAGASDWTRALRIALAKRDGPIVPLVTDIIGPDRYVSERHLCIDTTAAGGNASLLASST